MFGRRGNVGGQGGDCAGSGLVGLRPEGGGEDENEDGDAGFRNHGDPFEESANCSNWRPNAHRSVRYSIIFGLANDMTDTNQSSETPAAQAPAEKSAMEIGDILKILPHRFPFLLIDRVLELVRMKRIVALKNVTITEPFFQGHFPDKPIMPGVLIVEAIAQAGGLLLLTEVPNRDEMLMVFTGIEKARFRRPVVPGDQLRIEVEVRAWRVTAARLEGKAYVDGKVAAEGTVTCRLVPRVVGAGTPETAGENL